LGTVILKVPSNVGPPPPKPVYVECPHERTELRAQTRGAVRKPFLVACYQCLDCGKRVRDAKAGSLSREAVRSLPPFDQEFRERKGEERAKRGAEARAAYQAAWWAWYSAYLVSPKWYALRDRVLMRDRYRCQVSGCPSPATQVHHLTYERVGAESLDDLVSVCDPCHELCHRRGPV
jgi:5-methylcytosine-specific restriction endonuclease McrA